MGRKELMRTSCVFLMVAGLLMQPFVALAQIADDDPDAPQSQHVTIGPPSSEDVGNYTRRIDECPYLTHAQKLDLLRKKIKYVFVLFQENRSFDFYFGTYPGARGRF